MQNNKDKQNLHEFEPGAMPELDDQDYYDRQLIKHMETWTVIAYFFAACVSVAAWLLILKAFNLL